MNRSFNLLVVILALAVLVLSRAQADTQYLPSTAQGDPSVLWPPVWIGELPGGRFTGPATIACRSDGRVFIGTYGVLPDGYDGPLVLEAVREPPQLVDTGYRNAGGKQLTVEGEALSACGFPRAALVQPLPPSRIGIEAIP